MRQSQFRHRQPQIVQAPAFIYRQIHRHRHTGRIALNALRTVFRRQQNGFIEHQQLRQLARADFFQHLIHIILLAFHWARVVWTRTAVQMAAEEQRRRAAAEQQSKGLLDDAPDTEKRPDPPEDQEPRQP